MNHYSQTKHENPIVGTQRAVSASVATGRDLSTNSLEQGIVTPCSFNSFSLKNQTKELILI
jgi:hypothetical protein